MHAIDSTVIALPSDLKKYALRTVLAKEDHQDMAVTEKTMVVSGLPNKVVLDIVVILFCIVFFFLKQAIQPRSTYASYFFQRGIQFWNTYIG